MSNDIRKFVKGVGITPTTSSPINEKGELRVNDSDGKLRYHNGTNESAVVTESHAATLTNKTIDGDDNTLQDISLSSLKVEAGDANKVIRRDASGSVISGNDLPNSSPILTTDATQTITNKTIDGDDNTIQDVALTSLKQVVADANKVIRRDSSGVVISGNDLPNTSPIVTTDATQTLTNKTIDGDDNTVQDLALTSLKTVVADANKVLRRDASGDVISGNDLPNSSPILTTDAAQTITNKTIDGDDNTLQDIDLPSLKTIATDADKVIRRDSSGAVISGNTLPNSSPIVTTDATQVLTNKDIDGGTASDNRRITLPQDTYTNINALTRKEGTILYANDTDKVYIDDGTNLKEIGSGGGELNFLQLSNKAFDAESGTAGWSTYKDAAQARPEDGTGGSPSVVSAISTTTTNPLSGTRSFLLAKGSGNAQGEGWSVDFQIDRAHFARVLQIEFDYQVESGTFVAGNTIDYTTAGDSDLIVYIYDIDNNQLIEPTTFRLYSNASNIADKFVGNFQTSADSINYRLIFHVATASTADWTLKVDNVVVKPAKYTYGTPITDWQIFNIDVREQSTFPHINRNSEFASRSAVWRRVGSEMEVNFRLIRNGSSSSGGGGRILLKLPDGYSINPSLATGFFTGTAFSSQTSTVQYSYEQFNNIFLHPMTTLFSTATSYNNTNYPPNSFFAGFFSVPIAGWSSSVKISEPMELRDVVCRVVKDSGSPQTLTPTTSVIQFTNKKVDTTNSFDLVNNRFVAPVSGWYLVNYGVDLQYLSGITRASIFVKINNSGPELLIDEKELDLVTSSYRPHTSSGVLYLNAGDYLEVQGRTASGNALVALGASGFEYTFLNVTRLPSSQALAQSEQVVVRAWNGSGQTITNNPGSVAAITQLTNFTKLQDTHNALDAANGTFTAPTAGFYVFNFTPGFNDLFSSEIQFRLVDSTNTTILAISGAHVQSGGRAIANNTLTYYLNAGEQVRLKLALYNAGSNRNLIVNQPENILSIYKL